jgi:deazaflavin-dependent oxidoreductase (nitroreductase family)
VKVFDNPTAWVRSHIRDYVESDGRKGHRWRGLPTLLLTTRGRKSGKLRRTALIYGRDGKNYMLVASSGGAPNHPLWYLNLIESPEVEVQVAADTFAARARTATTKEKPRLWRLMTGIFPHYEEAVSVTRSAAERFRYAAHTMEYILLLPFVVAGWGAP